LGVLHCIFKAVSLGKGLLLVFNTPPLPRAGREPEVGSSCLQESRLLPLLSNQLDSEGASLGPPYVRLLVIGEGMLRYASKDVLQPLFQGVLKNPLCPTLSFGHSEIRSSRYKFNLFLFLN
jgi:hypothetical protein